MGVITFGGFGDQLNALLVMNSLQNKLKFSIRLHPQTNSSQNFSVAASLFPDLQICKNCLQKKTFHRYFLRTRLEFKETVVRHKPWFLSSVIPSQNLTSDTKEIENLDKANLKFPIFGGYVSDLATTKGLSRLDFLNHSLGLEEIVWPKRGILRLGNYFDNDFKYITIHDGIDSSKESRGLSTKQLDNATWNRIVLQLKFRHPNFKIVQLGTHKSQQVTHVDFDLRGLTTLNDVVKILNKSKLHIDGDSGIARCARVLGVPSITFFLSTSPIYYGLPGAESIGPKFCGSCSWWANETWNFECPMGMHTPICRSTFPWEEIVARSEKFLSSQ